MRISGLCKNYLITLSLKNYWVINKIKLKSIHKPHFGCEYGLLSLPVTIILEVENFTELYKLIYMLLATRLIPKNRKAFVIQTGTSLRIKGALIIITQEQQVHI